MSDLKEKLNSSICLVKFTKIDGSERIMRCTLREDLLPNSDDVVSDKQIKRKINEAVQAVFDLDNKDWRSFRKDSVIEFEVLS
jgi:hypothetical protein